MRFAYADPPYLGMCDKYGHHHEEPYGCWDDPETHRLLFKNLAEFDGWAYSLSSVTLATLLPMAPNARVASWVKPFASFKPNVRIAYAWEPVIFKGVCENATEGIPFGRDFLSERIAMKRGFFGAKPEAFCRWISILVGYRDGIDELVDLFPGTGVMGKTLNQGVLL